MLTRRNSSPAVMNRAKTRRESAKKSAVLSRKNSSPAKLNEVIKGKINKTMLADRLPVKIFKNIDQENIISYSGQVTERNVPSFQAIYMTANNRRDNIVLIESIQSNDENTYLTLIDNLVKQYKENPEAITVIINETDKKIDKKELVARLKDGLNESLADDPTKLMGFTIKEENHPVTFTIQPKVFAKRLKQLDEKEGLSMLQKLSRGNLQPFDILDLKSAPPVEYPQTQEWGLLKDTINNEYFIISGDQGAVDWAPFSTGVGKKFQAIAHAHPIGTKDDLLSRKIGQPISLQDLIRNFDQKETAKDDRDDLIASVKLAGKREEVVVEDGSDEGMDLLAKFGLLDEHIMEEQVQVIDPQRMIPFIRTLILPSVSDVRFSADDQLPKHSVIVPYAWDAKTEQIVDLNANNQENQITFEIQKAQYFGVENKFGKKSVTAILAAVVGEKSVWNVQITASPDASHDTAGFSFG